MQKEGKTDRTQTDRQRQAGRQKTDRKKRKYRWKAIKGGRQTTRKTDTHKAKQTGRQIQGWTTKLTDRQWDKQKNRLIRRTDRSMERHTEGNT